MAKPVGNRSVWDIGAAHWDQRDLYTVGAETDDSGYERGPSVHPDIGSVAYPREAHLPPDATKPIHSLYRARRFFRREAWPSMDLLPGKVVRSDVDLRADVQRAISTGHFDASDVAVRVREAVVTLSGTVRSRRDKRRAGTLAARCAGVTRVENQLEVRRHPIEPGVTALRLSAF